MFKFVTLFAVILSATAAMADGGGPSTSATGRSLVTSIRPMARPDNFSVTLRPMPRPAGFSVNSNDSCNSVCSMNFETDLNAARRQGLRNGANVTLYSDRIQIGDGYYSRSQGHFLGRGSYGRSVDPNSVGSAPGQYNPSDRKSVV